MTSRTPASRRSTSRPQQAAVLLAVLMAAAVPTLSAMEAAAAATAQSIDAHDRQAIKAMLVEEAERFGVPPALALALAKVESDFQPRAKGLDGAVGVLQILPRTAVRENGIGADELIEPRLNIQIGLDRLARLHQQLGGRPGDWQLALAAYHADRPDLAGDDFAATVMRWRGLYAAQADLWNAFDRPDAARVADAAPTAQGSTVGADAWPQAGAVAETATALTAGIDRRRAAARWWLDDFGPRRHNNRIRVW